MASTRHCQCLRTTLSESPSAGLARTHKPMVHTMRVFQNEVEFITRLLLPVRSRPGGPVDQIFLVIYVDPQQAAA